MPRRTRAKTGSKCLARPRRHSKPLCIPFVIHVAFGAPTPKAVTEEVSLRPAKTSPISKQSYPKSARGALRSERFRFIDAKAHAHDGRFGGCIAARTQVHLYEARLCRRKRLS